MGDETNEGARQGEEPAETVGSSASEPADGAGHADASSAPPGTDDASTVPAEATPAAEATVAGGGGGRYEQLMAKRQSSGLTDPEAEELGRLIAEREGKPYSSAQSLKQGPGGEVQSD
jgi:hypothetical protein